MGRIERFEDIKAWQKARQLNRLIYEITREGAFSRDFALRDQIRRASISIMSNIAEGFHRDGDKEFSQFLSVAKGSAGEVKSQLYIAFDAGLIGQEQFDNASRQTDDIIRLISGFMKYLSDSAFKGSKYAKPK